MITLFRQCSLADLDVLREFSRQRYLETISKDFQGHGLGRFLMDQAIGIALQRKKKYVWLGVWEKNTKALAFYKKSGFYPVGTHTFVMGDDVQTDYIMRRDLAS